MKESPKPSEEAGPATARADADHVDANPSSTSGSSPQRIPEHTLDPVAQWLDSARGAISRGAPLAVRATKEVAHRGQELPFVQAIRFGETMRRVARTTADAREGPQAFREKRPPSWGAH